MNWKIPGGLTLTSITAAQTYHFNAVNDDLTPFLADQVYNVNYPAAGVTEKMYLYQVEYTLDDKGARTSLSFCRLGCIVAGISIGEVQRKITASGSLPKS